MLIPEIEQNELTTNNFSEKLIHRLEGVKVEDHSIV
jgi:hypothetical protein